ncbi:MAG: HlyC/CorC family transporter [Actinobacteria bacterium]|nr:HlyC/CorC family transporter [Actinomycetota bacterium]
MSPLTVVILTILIIAASAFFVAVEFSLLAAKRHRLEDSAMSSRAARAALRSSSELTLLLAGSQLGITVATLALGAITKPAVHYWLTPVFTNWGLPLIAADIAGFFLALLIVTFLHLVIGEMAPKSWAIAHPERSATLLAIPMRGFMWVFRPLLRVLNATANWLVKRAGVDPADNIGAGQNAHDLRELVTHSINVGTLNPGYSAHFEGALDMERFTIGDIPAANDPLTVVASTATVGDVRAATRESGHLRILVGSAAAVTGVVHVRDTLDHPDATPLTQFTRDTFRLDRATTLQAALATMQKRRTHLVVLVDDGSTCGVVTMTDVLGRLFP